MVFNVENSKAGLAIWLVFVCILFVCIGFYMAKSSSGQKKYKVILSWIIYVIYAGLFVSIAPLYMNGHKVLAIVFFCCIVLILLALIIFSAISKLAKKIKYKRSPKFETVGRICWARVASTTEKLVDDIVTDYKAFLKVKVKFKDANGDTQVAESLKTYRLYEIAYMNSLPELKISTALGLCEINVDVSQAPKTYSDKDLEGIESLTKVIIESIRNRENLR